MFRTNTHPHRHRLLSLAMACVSAFVAACSFDGGDAARRTESLSESVLRIDTRGCRNELHRATAFAVDDRLAVSVGHAFDDIASFDVRTLDGTVIGAHVVVLDLERDITVLALDTALPSHGELAPHYDNDDDIVRLITLSHDGRQTTERPVDVIRYVRLSLDGSGERDGLELATAIEPGDSGSPLLNTRGYVRGMVFASATSGDRGWAIGSSELTAAVGRADPTDPPITIECS